jgi:HD-GYP domain-containing protein (c-di-GMP phosphodiesterase class II)
MHRKAIAVGELQFGMYVAELDRPWIGTPFAFQGFWLRTEQQLEALRKFCRHVFVDTARSEAQTRTRAPRVQASPATPAFSLHGTAGYAGQSDLASEIQAAGELYSQTCSALDELLVPLEKGATALDGSRLQQLVNGLADTVIRNPDALLLLSKVRQATTPAHARALQVSVYMMVFGRFLQREPDEIYLLGLLGLLQDVGKARLPVALLHSHAPLTAEERELMKKHVELSAHIIGVTSGLPPKLAQLALLHHERQDGAGYPRGLRGYQIGLFGAIAAICDAYDALLAPPPYGEGRSPSAAVGLLTKDRGSVFHGPLVEQFIRCMGAFPVGSAVELNSGEAGVVVGEHVMQRLTPKVLIVFDARGKRLAECRVVDLAASPDLRIRRTLEEGKLAFDARQLCLRR